MKLFGANPSPLFRKVRVVLEEKGLRYYRALLSRPSFKTAMAH